MGGRSRIWGSDSGHVVVVYAALAGLAMIGLALLLRTGTDWVKRLLLIALLCLCAETVSAQTITRTLRWQQAAPLADVQGYGYTLQVDAGTPVILTATCLAGVPVTCSAPVSFIAGPHTLLLTVTNGFGTASATLTGVPPTIPASVTISITMTIP